MFCYGNTFNKLLLTVDVVSSSSSFGSRPESGKNSEGALSSKRCSLGLEQTSNPSRVENRCGKESTSFQGGSKRQTSVDPISQVARVPVPLGSLSNHEKMKNE